MTDVHDFEQFSCPPALFLEKALGTPGGLLFYQADAVWAFLLPPNTIDQCIPPARVFKQVLTSLMWVDGCQIISIFLTFNDLTLDRISLCLSFGRS